MAKWAGPVSTGEVELEIAELLTWGPTPERAPRLAWREGRIELVGLVESALGDDLFAVRLGSSVVTMEIPTGEEIHGKWILVTIEPGQLTLYPYTS
ncbi:hypothetical protein [Amycolatopsis albispora]|uniref:hypothetical protein n=1 Tax=Amycolatopsis albispora TaxID=1804986 RepID=UPI0013B36EEB|nr:hypothetical protein [Amycolatopsis albispora]